MTTISTLLGNIKTLIAKYHYTKSEVDTALEAKLDSTDAFSGSYNDLTNKPSSYAAGDVVDATAHSNLETAANATQATINAAIDTKIGSLSDIELFTVVNSLGTASAETMNKMYLIPEEDPETEDGYQVYFTVRTGTAGNYSYDWERGDPARIDLSNFYTKTETDNTFLAKADFLDALNDAIEDAIEAEV